MIKYLFGELLTKRTSVTSRNTERWNKGWQSNDKVVIGRKMKVKREN